MKTPLLHQLKQINNNPCINEDLGFQSPKVSGLKLFEVHEHTKIQFLEKVKWNFKNLSPGNQWNPFALSFKANFMTFHA